MKFDFHRLHVAVPNFLHWITTSRQDIRLFMLYCLRADEKSISPKYQTGILPAKSEGIGHGRVNCHLAALSPHEIQI